jgi:small subunit ribosomal protein S20
MPKSKSVLKRQRQTERQRVRNKAVRSELRTRERRVRSGADPAELRGLQKRLDQAAAKGAVHPNKAARKKSRLARSATKPA